jgi:hypothetical protein
LLLPAESSGQESVNVPFSPVEVNLKHNLHKAQRYVKKRTIFTYPSQNGAAGTP